MAEATLAPYQPSWRDRLAQALMGDGRPSPARESFVRGLTGSAGLSGTGMGVLDATPLGAGFAVDDFRNAETMTDRVMAGLAVLPTAASVAKPAARAMGDILGYMRPKTAANLAAKPSSMYDPPSRLPRAFEEDYPNGAQVNAAGNITRTIDGDPINPGAYVVGRAQDGGSDVALPGEALDKIAKAGTGRGLVVVPEGGLGKDSGRYRKARLSSDEWEALKPWEREASDGFRRSIDVTINPDPAAFERAARHEVSHLVNDIAGTGNVTKHGKPTIKRIDSAFQAELDAIYDHLNRPEKWKGGLFTPGDKKYPKAEWADEYAAEAVRAYMTDPNYMKTVAPNTAKAIRKVNKNETLNKVIQFNALAWPGAALGVSAYRQNEGE